MFTEGEFGCDSFAFSGVVSEGLWGNKGDGESAAVASGGRRGRLS